MVRTALMFLLFATAAQSVQAAAVAFNGFANFIGGGTNVIGSNDAAIVLFINVPDGVVTSGPASGSFRLGGTTFNITGGTVFAIDGGANDTGLFNNITFTDGVNSGTMTFTFSPGNVISNSNVNSANLAALTVGFVSSGFTIDFGGGAGDFAATVSGVPEPASLLGLSALAIGFVGYRVRRRRQAAD